jgi:peptidoglycan/xylan/chitin deacetylase (PgdA/CDA1 family)
MLYRVSPEPVRAFEPNRILKITPDFLDNVVRQVIEAGFDLLSMDEVLERLAARRSARPFACFTLVDGYRDNLEYALPVFKRYGAPFTVYVPTDYMDGTGGLWWLTLKRAIEASDSFRVMIDGAERRFDTATVAAKDFAYAEIYWRLRRIPEEPSRKAIAKIAADCGLHADALCRELTMNWD